MAPAALLRAPRVRQALPRRRRWSAGTKLPFGIFGGKDDEQSARDPKPRLSDGRPESPFEESMPGAAAQGRLEGGACPTLEKGRNLPSAGRFRQGSGRGPADPGAVGFPQLGERRPRSRLQRLLRAVCPGSLGGGARRSCPGRRSCWGGGVALKRCPSAPLESRPADTTHVLFPRKFWRRLS